MRIIKIIVPCLLLGACMFGTSKSSKFYTQSATSNGVISADYTAFVGVNRVQLPKYVDRPQMVTQQKNSVQIDISEYNRWVESPSILATRVLTADLSTLLPAAQIKVNQSKGESFDRIVSVEIIKMKAVLGDKAEMEAWYVIRGDSKKILTQQKITATVAIGKTYEDIANGYSRLLEELSQEIATALIKK